MQQKIDYWVDFLRGESVKGAIPGYRLTMSAKLDHPTNHTMKKLLLSDFFVAVFLFAFAPVNCYAGSATWNQTTTDSEWTTATNWTPATIPNGPADIATFANSSSIKPLVNSNIEVDSIVFNVGANSFDIVENTSMSTLTISGAGVSNSSSVIQHFTTKFATGQIHFTNSASAGNTRTAYTNDSIGDFATGGTTMFFDTATAGSATFNNKGAQGATLPSGSTQFFANSTAGTATFTNEAPPGFGPGGSISFNDNSSAGSGVFNSLKDSNIYFYDSSTAAVGNFTNAGTITFFESSTAGAATFNNMATLSFQGLSTAASATITNEGVNVSGTPNGSTTFFGASAGNATIVNNPSTISSISAGTTVINNGASAANSTLIANGSIGSFPGGAIDFQGDGDGGQCRVEVFGNGGLYLDNHLPGSVTIGSIEGGGLVQLAANNLTVGSNNLSTTFSGLIQDGPSGPGGSLRKMGTGKLTLTGANTYTGGTVVTSGTLLVNNTAGSGLGKGAVQAMAGTLGGSGIISAAVAVGTGRGTGAVLAPGQNSVIPGTLTIRKQLTLKADATYRVTFNSNTPAADEVIAKGVRIDGAQIAFNDGGSGSLPPGTVFTVISNTSANPISGTFTNLPDGAIVTVGGNNFQADYEGGDGNDLTLTVL